VQQAGYSTAQKIVAALRKYFLCCL